MRFKIAVVALFLTLTARGLFAQTIQARLNVLEAEIRRLQHEVESLKREAAATEPFEATATDSPPESLAEAKDRRFSDQILVPDLGTDERDHEFQGRPEIFLQNRFSRNSVNAADPAHTENNFQLTRIEIRWAGSVSPRIGAGLEMQFHPAPAGSPDEIVNDAFLEFYPTSSVTVRAGQFVKPFGFDVQQSSSEREYPERAIFEGYFFPGERDRGVMLRWEAGPNPPLALRNTTLSIAVLNGNRFFDDPDKRVNTVFRARRLFPAAGLALGASVEFGSQALPSDAGASSNVTILGIDFQHTFGRFGTRVEVVRGTRPSTLLAREPEFTPAFFPGAQTSGGNLSGFLHLTAADQLYGRYDTLFGDPVSGQTVRATSVGYFRLIGERTRLGLNYQWKNRPSFNDDAVNTKFQTTLGIVF